ncbi:dihydroorotase-like cyclic amidohydrolase [Paenibacillus sp. V4I5]|nr:dihydroorotase-like cyclic amidohydrolase [Paenibacillus sp. V4I5]
MTKKPADVFGLPYGTLEVGSAADITIVDLETEREVVKEEIVSRSKNTPFIGWKLQGWPVVTIASGKVVWS